MTTATPQLRGQNYERTQAGQASCLDVWLVDLPADDVRLALARREPIDILPMVGEAHPIDTAMTVRKHGVREATGIHSFVDIQYATSNVGRFKYATPDTSGGQFVWSVSFETFDAVKIPFAYRNKITVSAGGQTVEKIVWDADAREVREKRTVVRAEWEIPKPSHTQIAIFESQVGFIHEIGGRLYLFRPASLQPKDNNTYRVLASWTYDDGTRYVASRDPTRMLLPGDPSFPVNPPPAAGYIRDPYNTLQIIKSPDPETIPPELVQIPEYFDGALRSWEFLPGVPNLEG